MLKALGNLTGFWIPVDQFNTMDFLICLVFIQRARRFLSCTRRVVEGSRGLGSGTGPNPRYVSTLLQDHLGQLRGSRWPALGRARRAQVTGRAGEGEQVPGVAFRALDAGETMLEKTIIQIPLHLLVDQAGRVPRSPLHQCHRREIAESRLSSRISGATFPL